MTVRVAVSTIGRFHHFDLAAQLYKRGYLAGLYSGYPRWKVDTVPRQFVHSFPYVIAPAMALYRLEFNRMADGLSRASHETLDRWVARVLQPCDVLVCNHGNGLHSYQTARRFGARVVCDCGQAHIEFERDTLAQEYRRWGFSYHDYDPRSRERRLREYEEADLITVPSSFVERTFVERGVPASKLAVIPYGVELSLFHPTPKMHDVFRILFVGQLGIRKGLPYLLQALSGLRQPDVELVLIGGLTSEAKAILKGHGSDVRYRYMGFLPRAALHAEYSKGSVLVLPSIVEGLAYVMAQAMACGLPVIATSNTGAENLFTSGVEGFIVPPADAIALREKILYLYENRETRDEMAQAALDRVRRLGGWDSYGERVVQMYSALCRKGSGPPDAGPLESRG